MSITREQVEPELRSGGVALRVVYLGFFPVKLPVHDMTPDMRSLLLKYSIDSLDLMAKDIPPAHPNSVLSLVLEKPKLVNRYVDIKISAQFIAVIHDDPMEREKNGNLLLRVPMKFTSVIERVEHTDCFAFIAKKLDGNQRRCSVFKTEKLELADQIMQIMEHAMTICNEEQARAEEEESASGSATPIATTPLAPPMNPTFPVFSVPTTPMTPSTPTPGGITPVGRRQPPLTTHYIRLGPKAQELAQYRWYHGVLSRTDAMKRVTRPGEFLIRESENQPGQVILTGMNDQSHEKHLLLIDKEGKVKTQDRDFENVAELIKFYLEGGSLIIMANENQLRLTHPVDRPH